MDKTRYIYEATDGREMLMGNCDLLETVAYISRQAQIVHSRMKDRDQEAARMFREMLTAVFSDPNSPAWDRVEDEGGRGIDFFHVKRKTGGGGVDRAQPK